MKKACVLGLLVLAMAACDDGSEESMDVSSFAKSTANALCDWQSRCGLMPDVETCVASQPIDLGAIESLVEGDIVAYDEGLASSCLSAIKGMECGLDLDDLDACDAVFKGKLEVGATCFSDIECVSDWCETDDPDCEDACCTGKCVADPEPTLVAIGQSCTADDADCVDGAYCDDTTVLCTARKASGESCTASWECQEGLQCDQPSWDEPGSCAPLPGNGEPCTYACAGDLICKDVDETTWVGTCGAPSKLGESCESLFDCENWLHVCENGKCAERAILGTECTESEWGDSNCVVYGECKDGKCVMLPRLGEPCPDDDCLGGLECINGTCQVEVEDDCR